MKRSQLAVIFSSLHLHRMLRWRCLQWFLVAMMSASIILTPALAGINAGGVNQGTQYTLNANDVLVEINIGVAGTVANPGGTAAGGTVNTGALQAWGGTLNVASGTGFSAVGGQEVSRLQIGQNFNFTGIITVIDATRVGAAAATPSILNIGGGPNSTFTLGTGGSIAIQGSSSVIVSSSFVNRGTIVTGALSNFVFDGDSFHAAGGAINGDITWGPNNNNSRLDISQTNTGTGTIDFGGNIIALERTVQDAILGQRVASLSNDIILNRDTTIQVDSRVAAQLVNGVIPNTVAQLTLSGIIDARGNDITKTGTGVLNLRGALLQNATDTFTIQQGWVTFQNNLGDGTIQFNGVDTRLRYLGGGNLPLNNIFNFNQGGTLDIAGGTVSLNGTIDATGEIRKMGAGTLVLAATASPTNRTGILNIAEGAVRFDSVARLGTGGIRLGNGTSLINGTLGDVTITNAIQFNGSATIDTRDDNWTFDNAANLSGGGTLIKSGIGAMIFAPNSVHNNALGLNLRIDAGSVEFSSLTGFVGREIRFNGNDPTNPNSLKYTGAPNSNITLRNSIVLGDGGAGGTVFGVIEVADTTTLTLTDAVTEANATRPGTFIKAGDGTLILSGKNTFTGEMIIWDGTLKVKTVDALAAASGLNTDNDGIFDMTENNQTLRGLTGAGGEIQMGDRTLTLNLQGTHDFGGRLIGTNKSKLDISARDLRAVGLIPGSLSLSLEDFQGSLHLRQGTQQLDITTRLPEPTLTVTGDWTPGVNTNIIFDLNAGSQPISQNNPTGAVDLIQYPNAMNPLVIEVNGIANFANADFRVNVDPQIVDGTFLVGRINANNIIAPVNLTAFSLLQNTIIDLNNDTTQLDIYTEITGFSKLREAGVSLSENQYQAALNLDRVRTIPTTANSGMMPILKNIFRVDATTNNPIKMQSDLKNLLTQLSGDTHANAMFLTQSRPWQNLWQQLSDDSQMYFVGGAANSRGEVLRGQTPLAKMNRMWITPTYSGATFADDDNARGGTIDRLGFQMGMDRRVRPNATVGGFLGFNNSRLHQGDDRVQASDLQLGVYASGMLGYYVEVRGMGGIGFQSYESTRTINDLEWLGPDFTSRMSATGKANGCSAFSNLEVSRPLFFGLFILRPTWGLDVEYGVRDAFSEKGDAIALHVARSTAVRVATRIGFATESGTMKRVSLTTRIFGGMQFGGDDMRTDSQFVGIGAYPYQHIRAVQTGWAFVEGGVGTRIFVNDARTFAFRANYDGMISRHFGNHAIGCGLQWIF